jgi:hypothetical protein
MDYTLTIRFDDDAHSLSAKNGIAANLLGELLLSLSKAVGLKKEDNLTVSDIRGNCYALDLTTNSECLFNSTEIVHKQISENDYSGFNSDQRRYAKTLDSIIQNTGCRINVYNPLKKFNYKIAEISFENKVDFYFEIDSIYGIIASIGSSSLDTQPSIKLSKEGYDIHVTGDQEKRLVRYFKKDRLLLTIKKKINFDTNKIETASLIDFEVMKNSAERFSNKTTNLIEQYKKRGLFPKVKDTVSSIRELRGMVNPSPLVDIKNGQ